MWKLSYAVSPASADHSMIILTFHSISYLACKYCSAKNTSVDIFVLFCRFYVCIHYFCSINIPDIQLRAQISWLLVNCVYAYFNTQFECKWVTEAQPWEDPHTDPAWIWHQNWQPACVYNGEGWGRGSPAQLRFQCESRRCELHRWVTLLIAASHWIKPCVWVRNHTLLIQKQNSSLQHMICHSCFVVSYSRTEQVQGRGWEAFAKLLVEVVVIQSSHF